ncbi:hypothetical protein VaNZ11_004289 [Volvox africanus]|uniref:Ribosomal protein L10e/L16 domain-containing protein n=1 Tax=Volvox africanus TaxID=51714 RepID=A0ABQ5RX84_9CHLO|nr:hypothetical protein VaNZ11_004289 [Volvox africanus]
MKSFFGLFRATTGYLPLARSLSHARSFRSEAVKTRWSSITASLGSLTSTSGRDDCSRALGTASQHFALLGYALRTERTWGTLRAETTSLVRGPMMVSGNVWGSLVGPVRWCQKGQLSRQRVPKGAAINDNIMPNTTQLSYGLYGIRALSGKRVAANTLEAVRRTLRRKLKKTARLWVRVEATVPVTRKPLNIRMGKGKGAIDFYATAVRPGQIIYEMDRVPRTVALQAMQAAQYKFPVRLGFVEWS